MDVTLKTCSHCLISKPITEFYPSPSYADRHYGWCKKCHNTVGKAWRESNKERQKANVDKWGAANIEKRRKSRRESARRRRPFMTISERLHEAINSKLHRQVRTGKGGRRTFDVLGYSVEELMKHIESKFHPGMSWDNWGKWHIDHIRPKSSFQVASIDDPQLRECWALSNLQPLWKLDNLRKGAKTAA